METLFWVKGGRQDHEYSPNVAGGGRANVPSKDCIGGICRVPTMTVERIDPDIVGAAPQWDPHNSLPIEPKRAHHHHWLPKIENIPDEKNVIMEKRLKFI